MTNNYEALIEYLGQRHRIQVANRANPIYALSAFASKTEKEITILEDLIETVLEHKSRHIMMLTESAS